ncbi:MAG: hypothetical protein OEY43_04140 [Gammaproteobacteria bacterium]|nr:hypothetical protein [Gammaproteobacteria bacterium]
MQALLVFIILFMTIAVNLSHSVIARIGFNADYLMAALLAVVITGLVNHKKLFLIVLVIMCSVLANLPQEIMDRWGLEGDYFFAVLVGLVLTPVGAKMTGRF